MRKSLFALFAWMLVASMTAYFQLLDLGYGNGLVRHVTEADSKGDVDGMNEVLSTFVVVYAITLHRLTLTAMTPILPEPVREPPR